MSAKKIVCAPDAGLHAEAKHLENINDFTEVRLMPKKRKYYRKCGICGCRHEQSEMVRTNLSPNGWLCHDCYISENPEYEEEFW